MNFSTIVLVHVRYTLSI